MRRQARRRFEPATPALRFPGMGMRIDNLTTEGHMATYATDHGASCICPEMPRRRFEANAAAIRARHGFLTRDDLADIIGFDRLRRVLVRCGGCRFTAPAQDVPHLMRCVEAGGDYVRDVSLPTTDPIWTEGR